MHPAAAPTPPLGLAAAVRAGAPRVTTHRAAAHADERAAYAYVLERIAADAAAAADALAYWTRIAADPLAAGAWWLQTLPGRVARALRGAWGGRGTEPRHPPPLAPLAAVRAHARMHCAALAAAHDALATHLGALALAWHAHGPCAAAGAAALGADAAPPTSTSPTALLAAYDRLPARAALRTHAVPPRAVRTWPALVVYPLAALGTARAVAAHWHTLAALAADALDALRGLVVNWLYVPLVRMLQTLRLGEAERRMLVSRDTLHSDVASLERMVAALLADRGVHGAALTDAAARVQYGDLTPVMQLYEAQIRTPLRAALAGTLVRSVLIQVQKAKVDMEIALTGIDRLLRSQELLIGALGLAPAVVLAAALVRWARAALGTLAAPRAQRASARLAAWSALRAADAALGAGGDAHDARTHGHAVLAAAALRTALVRFVRAARLAPALAAAVDADIDALECAPSRARIDLLWRSWGAALAPSAATP